MVQKKAGTIYVVDPKSVENLDQNRVIEGTVVVRNERKPGFASISLEKTDFNLDAGGGGRKGGFMNKQRVVHFIGGPEEALVEFAKAYDLKGDDDFNAKTGLKKDIVVKESTTEPYPGAQAKINPTTGESMVTPDGEPIYRTTQLMDKNDPACKNEILEGIGETALAILQGETESAFSGSGSTGVE